MITEASIKAAIRNAVMAGKGKVELKDDGARGEGRLMISVRINGGRVTSEWYAVWYRDGRRGSAKVGSYPTMSIAAARADFKEGFLPAILRGAKPEAPRARRERRGVTLEDMCDFYIAHLEKEKRPSVRQVRLRLLGPTGIARSIGLRMRASDVRPEDITPHLAAIHERGAKVQADQIRSHLSSAFNFAMKSAHDYTQRRFGPAFGIVSNPVLAITRDLDARTPGERFLSPAEIRDLWFWLKDNRSEYSTAPAIQIMLASGQRVTEILRVTSESYNQTERFIAWSKTKNGLSHIAVLPVQAAEILSELPVNEFGLYFPRRAKPDAIAHIGTPLQVIDSYISETGANPFAPRDLRRTWKTLAGRAGLSKEIRDRIQNHSRSRDVSSRHYDRHDYLAEKRAAMMVWEDYLDRILAGRVDTEVVQLQPEQAA